MLPPGLVSDDTEHWFDKEKKTREIRRRLFEEQDNNRYKVVVLNLDMPAVIQLLKEKLD